jgi:hypothetical protein
VPTDQSHWHYNVDRALPRRSAARAGACAGHASVDRERRIEKQTSQPRWLR